MADERELFEQWFNIAMKASGQTDLEGELRQCDALGDRMGAGGSALSIPTQRERLGGSL
jgi:hypothetical protein